MEEFASFSSCLCLLTLFSAARQSELGEAAAAVATAATSGTVVASAAAVAAAVARGGLKRAQSDSNTSLTPPPGQVPKHSLSDHSLSMHRLQ